MVNLQINPIGKIKHENEESYIQLGPIHVSALEGLESFSHIQVLWWFSNSDNQESRTTLLEEKPYKNSPDTLGIFVTRSPRRPNPIALDTVQITYINKEKTIIGLTWIESFDNTPVLDIKPYTPSLDRVDSPLVPDWCSHWPKSYEESGDVDWENASH